MYIANPIWTRDSSQVGTLSDGWLQRVASSQSGEFQVLAQLSSYSEDISSWNDGLNLYMSQVSWITWRFITPRIALPEMNNFARWKITPWLNIWDSLSPMRWEIVQAWSRLTCVWVSLRQTSAELVLFLLQCLGIHTQGNALHAQCPPRCLLLCFIPNISIARTSIWQALKKKRNILASPPINEETYLSGCIWRGRWSKFTDLKRL